MWLEGYFFKNKILFLSRSGKVVFVFCILYILYFILSVTRYFKTLYYPSLSRRFSNEVNFTILR